MRRGKFDSFSRNEGVWADAGTIPHILNVGTRWEVKLT
jgi:hypothetical protein